MITRTLTTLACATGLLLSAAPAMASDKGLYGRGDATYDGVYRQSLSILALTSAGKKVPKSAITWLKSQQCPDGGFVEYRASAATPCPKQDPTNLVGRDLNGTALAIAALDAIGQRKPARKAAKWIAAQRNADRGWAYFPGPGSMSDSSSTALAVGSLKLLGRKATTKYLTKTQFGCDADKPVRGGLAFDTTSSEPNDGATAQAAFALGGGLAMPKTGRISKKAPRIKCSGKALPLADGALHYVYQRLLAEGGALPYGGGYPGTDFGGTAWAGMALAQAGVGRKAVKKTTRYLKKNQEMWIAGAEGDSAGSLATLIQYAEATGENPKNFGGTNLIKRLAKTQR